MLGVAQLGKHAQSVLSQVGTDMRPQAAALRRIQTQSGAGAAWM